MTMNEPQVGEAQTVSQLNTIFAQQRGLSRQAKVSSYAQRIVSLKRLEQAITANVDNITEAIIKDFGCRSKQEIILAEIYTSLAGVRYARKHLKQWMKPQKRHVSWLHQPAKAKVISQPKGVVGIISPWNYPFFLAIGPLITALAAGNRVMLKPSEASPYSSAFLAKFLGDLFEQKQVYVALGGIEVGQAFSELAFDHLLFTGSTALGKVIMSAAAKNLTPVTLELGGKSPVLLHPDYPIDAFARRIIHTKTMNSGQTCVAPDYLLVQEKSVAKLVDSLNAEFNRSYSDIGSDTDYGAIINQRQYHRLQGYLSDAEAKGAHIIRLAEPLAEANNGLCKMPLTLVLLPSDDMHVMQHEIFGAILPIVSYTSIDEAIAYINNHERPLALYYFDNNKRRAEQVLQQTVSGNACVNEALMHVGVDDLPFGGIGASGMGAYHGREGFDTFSHRKGVFVKGRFNSANFIRPPYKNYMKRFLRLLVR